MISFFLLKREKNKPTNQPTKIYCVVSITFATQEDGEEKKKKNLLASGTLCLKYRERFFALLKEQNNDEK